MELMMNMKLTKSELNAITNVAYIHTGWGKKYLLSPKTTTSKELQEFSDSLLHLEEEFDNLRSKPCSMDSKQYDRIRELRKILTKHDVECLRKFWAENPKYVEYWFDGKIPL